MKLNISKTILVTGGAGFIGSYLIEQLVKDKKNKIISLDNYFTGSKEEYSILDVARMFKTEIVMLPERKGNRMQSSLDTSKIEALGWKAKKNLADHIKEFISST
jgi:UDP-glucose 4-epimerase